MIKRWTLTLGLTALCHSTLTAQSLTSGTWTGSTTQPGEAPLTLMFDVSSVGDSLSILIRTPDRGDYPVSEAKLTGETLTFKFLPALGAVCTLKKQIDGSYSGDCVSEGGMSVTMVMTPPAKPGD
jgi:hypothetical protein